MDRPAAKKRPLSVLVFARATEAALELRVGALTARRSFWVVVALCAAVVVLLGMVVVAVPRAQAYDELLAEHLDLQERLRRIDTQMSSIDRILLRLRLYDAQLESLGEPRGESGPLPVETYANAELELPSGVDSMGGLRPSSAWAAGVEARANTFLTTFADREPSLNRFMTELEELEALERALPSMWPSRAVFTSGYGWRRNPLGRRWRFHSGIDLGADRGEPIYASAQGKVIMAGWSGGFGNYIEIDHGFGIVTLYGHCHRLLVKEGDIVKRGERIALMGSTGRSTGPHLHFEVHLDGTAVDPMEYLRGAKRPPAPRVPPSPAP